MVNNSFSGLWGFILNINNELLFLGLDLIAGLLPATYQFPKGGANERTI